MSNLNETPPAKYKITLAIAEKIYHSEGETMLEALNNLKQPEVLNAMAFLTAEYGKLSTPERRFTIGRLKMLFAKDYYRTILAKKLEISLR